MTSPMDDVTHDSAASPTPTPLPPPIPLSFAQAVASGTQASIHALVSGAMKKSKFLRDTQSYRNSSNFSSSPVPRTHSAFALIADFSGFEVSTSQVISLVSS